MRFDRLCFYLYENYFIVAFYPHRQSFINNATIKFIRAGILSRYCRGSLGSFVLDLGIGLITPFPHSEGMIPFIKTTLYTGHVKLK